MRVYAGLRKRKLEFRGLIFVHILSSFFHNLDDDSRMLNRDYSHEGPFNALETYQFVIIQYELSETNFIPVVF